MSSCDDYLQVGTPKSDVERKVVFSNDVTATAAVLGIYGRFMDSNSFASGSSNSVLALTGLSADELINYFDNPDMVEFEDNSINPSNYYVFQLWSTLYNSIYQANSVIEGINSSDGLSDRVRDQLTGEALFTRAFCHFYLVNLFGDVPLVITTDYRTNSTIPRTDSDVVYGQILNDLKEAKELLAEEYAASYAERIRPNRFTATALLARVYLYLKDWSNAELMASEVIGKASLYSMPDSVSDVFLSKSKESIWQLRPVINGDKGYTFEALYFSPTDYYTLQYNVLRNGIQNEFEVGDRRRVHWIGSLVYGEDTIYFPRKYRQDQFDSPLTEYSSVLRLAEQYLIRSEARAMQDNLDGDNSAKSDIDVIRKRAGLPPIDATAKTDILDAILKERRFEFMTEWGHRWFDLKRLGISKQELDGNKGEFDEVDELYPLPAREFKTNPMLKIQNDGY